MPFTPGRATLNCKGHLGQMADPADGGGEKEIEIQSGSSTTSPRTSHEKKVVLFGKTGAGKSTTANALVTGGTEKVVFKTSDAAKACTLEFQEESGRGWTVLDTIGLGEATTNDAIGLTDTRPEDADTRPERRLKAYLNSVKRPEYSHIIYVIQGDRLTRVDEVIWLLFCEIFKGGEAAFVILFTGVDKEWLEKHRDELPADMKEVNMKKVKICAVDIPPKNKIEGLEAVLVDVRRQEIEQLEAELEGFFAERNYKYVALEISGMTPEAITDRANSIIRKVVRKVKSMFGGDNLIKILKGDSFCTRNRSGDCLFCSGFLIPGKKIEGDR